MRTLIAGAGDIAIDAQGVDIYGRTLATLRLNGTDVARILVAEGLAVPYRGGRRINWCTRLTGLEG